MMAESVRLHHMTVRRLSLLMILERLARTHGLEFTIRGRQLMRVSGLTKQELRGTLITLRLKGAIDFTFDDGTEIRIAIGPDRTPGASEASARSGPRMKNHGEIVDGCRWLGQCRTTAARWRGQ
ncbi:MAG: hypothetical protein JWN86_2275 [Planctomycetota bacterium]|nr:hypothetical protein [Planctomycetota bacterium]